MGREKIHTGILHSTLTVVNPDSTFESVEAKTLV